MTTLLFIKRACELNKSHINSTDEYLCLRIDSFAVINLRGVSTNKTIIFDFVCVGVMCSGEYNACDVTLSVYPHRASLKNMPGHDGNRTTCLIDAHAQTCKLINQSKLRN